MRIDSRRELLDFFEVTWNDICRKQGVIEWTTKNLDFA